MKKMKKALALLLAGVMSMGMLAGCGAQKPTGEPAQPEQPPVAEQPAEPQAPETVRVASLSGPTSMGLAQLLTSDDEAFSHYDFEMFPAADAIVPAIAKGEIDIALIPANLAAVLYQKTEGAIEVLNINTLGVLEVVAGKDAGLTSMADLAGKTVYLAASGKGATPEYTARILLQAAGVAEDQVTLDFSNPEPAAVVAKLVSDPEAVAILPQPFATAATVQNENLGLAFSLTDAWQGLMTDGSQLVTGVTVVQKAFLEAHPEEVENFLAAQQASVAFVNADPKAAGAMIEELGIVKAPIATKAIPRCGLTALAGEEMKTALSGYLSALHGFDAKMVGGKLPDEAFYHI